MLRSSVLSNFNTGWKRHFSTALLAQAISIAPTMQTSRYRILLPALFLFLFPTNSALFYYQHGTRIATWLARLNTLKAVRFGDWDGLGIVLNFTPVSINTFSLKNKAPRKASNACRDAPRRHIVSFRGSDQKTLCAFLGVRPRWPVLCSLLSSPSTLTAIESIQ